MTLLAYLRQQASADSGLSALLGSAPFRWYDRSLPPQNAGIFPAVVARLISDPQTYGTWQRFTTSSSRVQLLIWGGKFADGISNCSNVDNALMTFFDTFNPIGIPGLSQYQNQVLNKMDGEFPYTDGPIFTKLLDISIFSNSTAI